MNMINKSVPARICRKCGDEKSSIEFSNTSPGVCKRCYNARKKLWRAQYPEIVRACEKERLHNPKRMQQKRKATADYRKRNPELDKANQTNSHLLRSYGITLEDYKRMYDEQEGKWREVEYVP